MSEEVAAQPGGEGQRIQPLAVPADERIARRRRESGWSVLWRNLPWLLLLGGTYALQQVPMAWRIADGRARGGLLLAVLGSGMALGTALGARESFPWTAWPPEGTLYERRTRLTLADLVHGWWQLLWLVPLGAIGATLVAAVTALTIVRPQDLAGVVQAADLGWYAIMAAITGLLIGRVLRPGAEAITSRGIHTSPASFAAWRSLSHALVDREARTLRLYTWQRPWLPRCVLTFGSDAELDRVSGLLAAANVACLPRGQESAADRVRWTVFLAVLLGITAGLTFGVMALLLMPGLVLVPVSWIGAPRVMRAAYMASDVVAQMPEIVLLLALLAGSTLHGEVERLRGVTTKKIVSEGA